MSHGHHGTICDCPGLRMGRGIHFALWQNGGSKRRKLSAHIPLSQHTLTPRVVGGRDQTSLTVAGIIGTFFCLIRSVRKPSDSHTSISLNTVRQHLRVRSAPFIMSQEKRNPSWTMLAGSVQLPMKYAHLARAHDDELIQRLCPDPEHGSKSHSGAARTQHNSSTQTGPKSKSRNWQATRVQRAELGRPVKTASPYMQRTRRPRRSATQGSLRRRHRTPSRTTRRRLLHSSRSQPGR